MRAKVEEQVLGWTAFAAIFFLLAAMGIWSLANVQVLPDDVLMKASQEGTRPIGAISESQAAFSFWSNVALLAIGCFCIFIAIVWAVRGSEY